MIKLTLGAVETHFADIVWEHAPLTTIELIAICAKELNWKRTTTYTVLKKLCEGEIFKMENSMVTVLLSKAEYHALQSENFVEKTFEGSLPAFIAAFTSRKTLSPEDLAQIKEMIRDFEEK